MANKTNPSTYTTSMVVFGNPRGTNLYGIMPINSVDPDDSRFEIWKANNEVQLNHLIQMENLKRKKFTKYQTYPLMKLPKFDKKLNRHTW